MAVAFGDDGQIDLLLFGTHAYQLPPVTLDEIRDAELYDRLLSEFPRWLTEALAKGIFA